MTSIQVIYYIVFATVILSINATKTIPNNTNVHTNLTITDYLWQYAASEEPLEDETQTFRVATHEMEKWKEFLQSRPDIDVKLVSWPQEQIIANIYKTCDEMKFTEFTLLYDIINPTCDILLVIDSDSELSERISIPAQIVTKCNFFAQSAKKIFLIIHFGTNMVNNNWINQLENTCKTTMKSPSDDLRHKNTLYSWMPQIFASAAEHRHHSRLHHDIQSKAAHKAHQNSRAYHVFSTRRKMHRVYTKKYKLLQLSRQQGTRRKIRKEASDVLKVPIGRRKLLCKYRKSCYKTGIIPNTWNINNILRFMSTDKEDSFEKANMTEMQKRNENEEKEEISEEELKLLCRYRKSCYEQVGVEIEKSAPKVLAGPIFFSRDNIMLPATKQKSTKEIAKKALEELEKRATTLQSISKKMITEKDSMKRMKKHLACKYRKSCYDSGVLPEIDILFDDLFQKIYHFLGRQKHQEITQEEFKDFNDDKKRIHCKYRKSCYNTGQKPVIKNSEIFNYAHIVKKHEGIIPLEMRCKYRKSCYDTGILPDLKKETAREETSPVVPKYTVTSLYHLKILCKYRKSCYKRKTEEQQNLDTELFDEAETLDKDELERKKEEERKEKVVKSFQKEPILKSEKTKEINELMTEECAFETKPIKETTDKKLIKNLKISVPQLKEKRTSVTQNEKSEEIAYKSRKKKTKEAEREEIPLQPVKKVQDTVLSATTMKQPITQKRSSERLESKKEKPKHGKVEKIKTRGEKAVKEKQVSVTEEKDFEELLPTEMEIPLSPINEVEPIFLQAKNITPYRELNVYDKNLNSLDFKISCKYRKSCYENGILPQFQTARTQDFKAEEDHRKLELQCKYRKSCYKTHKLPENLLKNFKMTYLEKEKEASEKYIPLTLRCKYRKSCYETGKLPSIEASIFRFPTIQIIKKHEGSVEEELNKEQLKLRCKYRKSCYESGSLYLNHTTYVVTTPVKEHENLQLKCKYRKSCYESMKLDMLLNKVRKKDEQKKVQEGIMETPHRTKPVIKQKEKEQKKETKKEVVDEENKRSRKMKSKKPKSEAEEEQYMQIEPVDSQLRQQATKLRSINSSQKLQCKYRLKCYDGMPLQQVMEEKRFEERRQLNIKDFRRANGAICNLYYISCRKQAGLPINVRAPIGPNGRRLCRKKKKEEEISY